MIDGIPEAGLHHVAGFRVASPKGPSSRRAIRRIRGAGGSAAEVAHSRMTCAACGMANGVAKHRPHCSQHKCHSDRQLWNLRGFRALCNILNIDVRSGARIKNQAESAAGFAACRQPGCALPESGKQMKREDRMKNIAAIPCRGIALANAVLASAFLLPASTAVATESVRTVVPAIRPPPIVTEL